jgi:hypothetical protein
MNLLMAGCTQSDEVVFRFSTSVAAKNDVVELQIGPGAAELAAPVVLFEDFHSRSSGYRRG